ncbi:hypothetical protein ESCO_003279 [Escovopsis weberi]|uniref:Cenp-O kinetochore centromere component n=1 Tax=Escovopsis weberi TaxID=150374 RepID=A0A0M8N1S4_ESCWE|nr:hypothetical protein ESCO_003279 [Escovopsis weberi]
MAADIVPADSLDAEIASLQEELATLRRAIKIECSTILSSASFQSRRAKHRLSPSSSSSSSSSSSPSSSSSKHSSKSKHKPSSSSSSPSNSSSSSSSSSLSSSSPSIPAVAALHAAHAQQSTYRIAASVTAFHVRDPDPHAVDGARVLGLRLEAIARGRFLTPYYVLLNRPFPGSKHLRIHRHTVPPAVPLAGLAGRYLPAPGPDPNPNRDSVSGAPRPRPQTQNLHAFATRLRREIVRYHNRLGASADLRRALDDTAEDTAAADLAIADVEAKHIALAWPAADRSARIVIDDDGALVHAVVMGPHGRDWLAARRLFGDHDRDRDRDRDQVHVHDIIKMLGIEE